MLEPRSAGALPVTPPMTFLLLIAVGLAIGFFYLRRYGRQAERDHSGPGGRTPPPGNLKDREVG
jgi:hypothetical protein